MALYSAAIPRALAGVPSSTTYRTATEVRRQPNVGSQSYMACCAVLDLAAGPRAAHWPMFSGDLAATICAGRAVAVEAPITAQHAQETAKYLSYGRARTRASSWGRAPTALPHPLV